MCVDDTTTHTCAFLSLLTSRSTSRFYVSSTTCLLYSRECAVENDTEEKNGWKKFLFLFSLHKEAAYSRSSITLRLNRWCYMDYFWTILSLYCISGPWACQLHCCLCRVRKLLDFIKNILICVLKVNKGLVTLERHEGEKLMTEFPFC